jgi:ABC-2 type transport system permease protein
MNQFRILIKYEWLNFRADRGLLLMVALVFSAGLYGIYYGSTEIARQRQNLADLEVLERHNVEEMKVKFPEATDAGNVGYYHSVFAVHPPNSWASLSLGQRDVNPYYIKLRLLGLQAQLYDSENVNPLKVLSGNFDLAFVLVYLFPLLIMALSFSVLSGEKEQGTLPLLLSQPISLSLVVGAKLSFRGMLVIGMALLLSVLAMAWAQVEPDGRVLLWLGAVVLYCLFWLGVAFLVAALHQGSAFNAVTLLGVWLLLTIVLPSLLNVYVALRQPVPQGLELTVRQREEVHSGWDKPKEEVLQKFFARYPEWTDTTTIRERFAWRWYYAMHEVGDMSVEDLASQYKTSLQERHRLTQQLNVVAVPVNVQGIFNALAASDLPGHLRFLQSAEDYHAQLKAFYYPFLFRQVNFTHADYAREPDHAFTPSPDFGTAYSGLVKLLMGVALVLGAGAVVMRVKQGGVR